MLKNREGVNGSLTGTWLAANLYLKTHVGWGKHRIASTSQRAIRVQPNDLRDPGGRRERLLCTR